MQFNLGRLVSRRFRRAHPDIFLRPRGADDEIARLFNVALVEILSTQRVGVLGLFDCAPDEQPASLFGGECQNVIRDPAADEREGPLTLRRSSEIQRPGFTP